MIRKTRIGLDVRYSVHSFTAKLGKICWVILSW